MADTTDPSPSPPFQFSLATLFVVVTGTSIACSLVLWHSMFGLMAAILLVGSGWSLAAVRAGHRRLAYVLAAPAMGVVGYMVLTIPMPIIAATMQPPEFQAELWLRPLAILWMSAATTLAAVFLRKQILAPGPRPSFGTVIGAVYLTAALFPIIWGVCATGRGLLFAMQGQRGDEVLIGMLICLFGIVLSSVLATLTLPFTIPLSMICCWVLRKIDPPRPQVVVEVQDIAVDQ